MTQSEQSILRHELGKIENFPKYCRDLLKINTKKDGLKPFIWNADQWRLYDEIVKRLAMGLTWFILLKPRQVGWSTFTEAFIYVLTSTNEYYNSLIIAHKDQASANLYEMFRTFYDNFPIEIRPKLKSVGNAHELRFRDLHSMIKVHTGGSETSTSSSTFHAAHISELSKWEHPEPAMISLMQTLPQSSFVMIESTAFGAGNYFHRMWQDAKSGASSIVPLFFAWWEHPEYQLDKYMDNKGFLIDWQPEYEEIEWTERYNLNQKQVNWMHHTIVNKCGNDFDMFLQEYPFDDETCFIVSGKPYFSIPALRQLKANVDSDCEPSNYDYSMIDNKFKMIKTPEGSIEVWDKPISLLDEERREIWQYRYSIGADVSEGIGIEGTGERRDKEDATDYNVMTVYDRVLKKQVAFSRNKLDADLYGEMLVATMLWYGSGVENYAYPFLTIEANGPGGSVIRRVIQLLMELGIPLTRLYHRGPHDKDYEPTTDQVGFKTTQANRDAKQHTILGNMKALIRDGNSGIRSKRTVSECLTFVRSSSGKPEAVSGAWDDAVMSYAFALEGDRRDILPVQIFAKSRIPKWALSSSDTRSTYYQRS